MRTQTESGSRRQEAHAGQDALMERGHLCPHGREARNARLERAPHALRARMPALQQGAQLRRTLIMKSLLSLLLLTFALTFPVAAQQKTPPSPGADRPLNLPKITEKKLANGLTVILAPLPNVPKVTAILTFRSATTGADRQSHSGIASIASAVANEGTDTRTSKQLKEELRSIGGTLGLGANADATSMTASALSEFSSKLFELMNDVVQHPAFPETELKLAKENTIQQIRAGRADPGFLVNERFQKAVFGDHPYSFFVPDEKSINALTRDDLRGFVSHYYLPNTSHLIVVGDIDVDKTFAEVEKLSAVGRAAPPQPKIIRRCRSAINGKSTS